MGNRKDDEGQTLLSPKRNAIGHDVNQGFSFQDEDAIYSDSDPALDPDPVLDSSCPGCFGVSPLATLASVVCFPLSVLACFGFVVVPERQHSAILFFGKYAGSIQQPGIHFLPPIGVEWRSISTATRTLNLKDLKILDRRGNPVVISAVVTFQPTSAKKARIDVEDPWPSSSVWGGRRSSGTAGETFMQLQAQAVLKQVTSLFPYEAPEGEPSLQTEGAHISAMLIARLQKRVSVAGAKITSFDLVDLSYAPEIASAMLVRQQAHALVDARKLIVQAAVDMTHQAVEDLELKSGKPLSTEMRENICSNLLTVVCSSEAVTPTLPVGNNN